MKTKTLTKIMITSLLGTTSCAVEHGVIVERQELSGERALYVNLIDAKHKKAREANTYKFNPGEYIADRKLFFTDSTYTEPFVYALAGDTISFHNPLHKTYVNINKCNRIHDVNGISEREIIKQMGPLIYQYREWLQNNH